ncbi:hypothetical protein EDD93_1466 [Streptomyces sp. 840.1]|uniref:DUF5959 family protein n=1 Tax=Streptomyces sp. 840.1 TaxID=2485152 RepID=UPI000F4ABC01|nr:DUF5959 family protein [Streptomyces sp. 840.1]ROQ67048.1 hypothetical protein EDD93_1466 [Streptomyces sp. 840.1]
MTDAASVDLIDMGDADGNRCVVRVTGRAQPGVLPGHDVLRADVLVSASFVDARLELYLVQKDLDTWQHDLTQLAPGGSATIGNDRGLRLHFFMHQDRTWSLTVEDPDRMTLALGIGQQETWARDHHQRLALVREAWPSEVVETAPMAYEWSPGRKS